MKKHSSRYADTDGSESAPESVNWLNQSDFLNRSEDSHGHMGGSMNRTRQIVTTPGQNYPSQAVLPYQGQSSSDHGFGEKYMEAEDEDRRILLAITVEVEDGHLEYIEIRDGDSAEAAATKFCQTHLLPEKYVAPLTEHIVEEVRRISKVDSSIRFASQDGMVYTDEGTQQDEQSTEKHWDPQDESDAYYGKQRYGNGNLGHNTNHGKKKPISVSLLSPTFTSLAKCQSTIHTDKPKDTRKSKQLSERAKAVYMRLYGEFLRQKQRIEEEKRWCQEQYKQRIERDKPPFSKKTRKLMRVRGRAAKQFRNYGELLYREGLTREEEKQRLIQQRLQEEEDKERQHLTLKPEISKLAKQLKREDGTVWDRLLMEKPRQGLQELRQEVWEAKFMECTFKPRVNHWPEEEQDLRHSRFDQLFWDAENRRRRQAEYGQWFPEGVTFRPNINQYSKGEDDHGEYHEGNVFDRLMQYAAKLSEKRKKLQQSRERGRKPVDSSTGQQLFRPQTGRKPLAERNISSLPIGEFLYLQRLELENKKKKLLDKDMKEKKELANGHYVGPRSKQLLNRAKDRKIHKLFEYLDKDKDGFVDINPADIKQLPQELFCEIPEIKDLLDFTQEHVSFKEFISLFSHIQKKCKGVPLRGTRCTKKTHHDTEKFSFQFKMDRNSRSLANRRRRFSSRHQWYKMLLMDKAKWQAKVENLRKEKQKLELAECTFRPAIHSTNARGHLALSDVPNSNNRNPEESHNAAIVEKELREVHGFIFQEVTVQKSGN